MVAAGADIEVPGPLRIFAGSPDDDSHQLYRFTRPVLHFFDAKGVSGPAAGLLQGELVVIGLDAAEPQLLQPVPHTAVPVRSDIGRAAECHGGQRQILLVNRSVLRKPAVVPAQADIGGGMVLDAGADGDVRRPAARLRRQRCGSQRQTPGQQEDEKPYARSCFSQRKLSAPSVPQGPGVLSRGLVLVRNQINLLARDFVHLSAGAYPRLNAGGLIVSQEKSLHPHHNIPPADLSREIRNTRIKSYFEWVKSSVSTGTWMILVTLIDILTSLKIFIASEKS